MSDTNERTPEQMNAHQRAIETAKRKTMFRAINAFSAVMEGLKPHERQAWINWLQAKYGANE